MCGRTSCYCGPDIYKSACGYYDPENGKYVKPDWKDVEGHNFTPSPNVAPTNFTPVLIPGSTWDDVNTSRAIQTMMWGMIPPWHQGEYKSHGLSTNNCRLENISTSKLYSPCLKKGRRCIIICDGFYEWQTTKGKNKQPYFIYSPQNDDMKVEDVNCWESATWTENKGWNGPNLMKMAGIFNEWHSQNEEIIFSYTIITMDSNSTLNWLHHRMPAILTTDEQVEGWLDVEGVASKDALELLTPVDKVSYHPVSTTVNNSSNKFHSCNKPIDINKKSKSGAFMQSWLSKAKQESSTTNDGQQAKKMKLG